MSRICAVPSVHAARAPTLYPVKKRLDVLLVERGLAASRSQAQALVMAGRVPGHAKAGEQVDEDADVVVEAPPRFVSRAARSSSTPSSVSNSTSRGRDCLDVGASTGGFTDCLLQRGAARVIALDVGHGQLDARLRDDAARDRARAHERPLRRRAPVRARAHHLRRLLHLRPHRAAARPAPPRSRAGRRSSWSSRSSRPAAPRSAAAASSATSRPAAAWCARWPGRARVGRRAARRRRLGPARPEGQPRDLPVHRPDRPATGPR